MARRGFSVMSIIFCRAEKLRPHFHSPKCVLPSSRISNPSTTFYGEETGLRVARKHLGWYFEKMQDAPDVRRELMAASNVGVAVCVDEKSLDDGCSRRRATVCNLGRYCSVRMKTTVFRLGHRRWGAVNDGENFTDAKDSGRNGTLEVPLRNHAERALSDYFSNLNGHKPAHLYDLVLREVEEPLFRAVLDYSSGNQCRAAAILGINRGTLRKKTAPVRPVG
jgi:Fis family transcriptional regulator